MADTVDQKTRSRIMSRVRSKDTKPEMLVRRTIFSLGYRYRLHSPRLPGKPDLVFAGRKKVIFVHGCFWHGHKCKRDKMPKSRIEYWRDKIAKNRRRDARNVRALHSLGWRCAIVWECEIKDMDHLSERLRQFIG